MHQGEATLLEVEQSIRQETTMRGNKLDTLTTLLEMDEASLFVLDLLECMQVKDLPEKVQLGWDLALKYSAIASQHHITSLAHLFPLGSLESTLVTSSTLMSRMDAAIDHVLGQVRAKRGTTKEQLCIGIRMATHFPRCT